MSLFEAQPVDERKERRKSILKISVIVILLVVAVLAYLLRYWPEEHAVNRFFTAIEKKDYDHAYALWTADPQWKQHADRYANYSFGQFELDWGPAGEYGVITSHKVNGAVSPPSKTGVTTGVVVVVTVNDRAEPACLWVEKRSKQISFSPLECQK